MKDKFLKFKDIGKAFFINFFILFLFWASDALIVSHYSDQFIADWAYLKSLIFILGTFIVLGIDQAIVRQNLNYKDTLYLTLLQILILGLISTVILYIFGFIDSFFKILICLITFAITLLLFSHERSLKNYSKSLVVFNSWKVIFFLLIIISFFNEVEQVLMLSLIIIVPYLINVIIINRKGIDTDKKVYKKALKTGSYFLLSSLSLNVILFLDQILINKLSNQQASELMFSHVTFFMAPFAAVLSFVGFVITPYIRDNKEKAFVFFKKYIFIFVLSGLIFSLVSFTIGTFIFTQLKEQEPVFWLSALLTSILFLRFLLVIPSSFFGAFASDVLLKSIAIKYNMINLIYLLGTCILFYYSNIGIIESLLFSLLITWLFRTIVGYWGIMKIER